MRRGGGGGAGAAAKGCRGCRGQGRSGDAGCDPALTAPLRRLRAGAAAGAAASITRVPTEVIKQRLQTGEFTGAINTIRAIIAREGFRGLCAPRLPSCLRGAAAARAVHCRRPQRQLLVLRGRRR